MVLNNFIEPPENLPNDGITLVPSSSGWHKRPPTVWDLQYEIQELKKQLQPKPLRLPKFVNTIIHRLNPFNYKHVDDIKPESWYDSW